MKYVEHNIPIPLSKLNMIQAVSTNKFSILSTVSKSDPKTNERSFQRSQNNELIDAENRMAKIEERLLAVESTTINRKFNYYMLSTTPRDVTFFSNS